MGVRNVFLKFSSELEDLCADKLSWRNVFCQCKARTW